MSTPRQIKASEVVKGMQVRFEASNGDATITTEGVVTKATGTYVAALFFGDYGINLNPDHPVTVLADPEPEWVEGAWYRCRMRSGDVRHLQRTADDGWSTTVDGYTAWMDKDGEVTVLGRVLIVDWPGDDAARELAQRQPLLDARTTSLKAGIEAVADAIRTQGGAR